MLSGILQRPLRVLLHPHSPRFGGSEGPWVVRASDLPGHTAGTTGTPDPDRDTPEALHPIPPSVSGECRSQSPLASLDRSHLRFPPLRSHVRASQECSAASRTLESCTAPR